MNKKKKAEVVIDIEGIIGTQQPSAVEIERAVLGVIINEGIAQFEVVAGLITHEYFYDDRHSKIFLAMQKLSLLQSPIEIHTICDELNKRKELEAVGSFYYITTLSSAGITSAYLERHCKILIEKFLCRQMIKIGMTGALEAANEANDVFELLDLFQSKLYQLSTVRFKNDFTDMPTNLAEVLTELDRKQNNGGKIDGVPSGFEKIDKVMNGWQRTNLIILAARPSIGKTAFALNVARNSASGEFAPPVPVGFFSLEMGRVQLVNRLLSSESEIGFDKIMNGTCNEEELKKLHTVTIPKLERYPIFIDDTASLTIMEFRAKARRMVEKHKVGLIIVDYLQLMSSVREDAFESRNDQIGKISRGLKITAKELKIPIIALSQMSREVDKTKHEPKLSDLRDSGNIEQDADDVLFLFKPNEDEHLIKIAKHRNGKLDRIKLKAQLWWQRFVTFGSDTKKEKSSTDQPVSEMLPIRPGEQFDEGVEEPELKF